MLYSNRTNKPADAYNVFIAHYGGALLRIATIQWSYIQYDYGLPPKCYDIRAIMLD